MLHRWSSTGGNVSRHPRTAFTAAVPGSLLAPEGQRLQVLASALHCAGGPPRSHAPAALGPQRSTVSRWKYPALTRGSRSRAAEPLTCSFGEL